MAGMPDADFLYSYCPAGVILTVQGATTTSPTLVLNRITSKAVAGFLLLPDAPATQKWYPLCIIGLQSIFQVGMFFLAVGVIVLGQGLLVSERELGVIKCYPGCWRRAGHRGRLLPLLPPAFGCADGSPYGRTADRLGAVGAPAL